MEKVIMTCIPTYEISDFDPNVTHFEDMGHITYEELIENGYKMRNKRSSSISCINVKLPFPVNTNRKNITVSSFEYDPEKKALYQIVKPCLHKDHKKMNYFKYERGDFYLKEAKKVENAKFIYFIDFLFIIIQKLDENRTFFTQIHMSDIGGLASNKLASTLLNRKIGASRGIELRYFFY
jgi:hypothetical protein